MASSPFLNFVFFFPCPLNVPWCLASVCNEFGSTEQFRRHLQVRVFKQRESDSDSYAARRRFFFFLWIIYLPSNFWINDLLFFVRNRDFAGQKKKTLDKTVPTPWKVHRYILR